MKRFADVRRFAAAVALIGIAIATLGAASTTVQTKTAPSDAQTIALLRQKIKYVFVLYQENRSFAPDVAYFQQMPELRPAA